MQQSFLDHVVSTGGDLKQSAEFEGYKSNHYQALSSFPSCKEKTTCHSARIHYDIWKPVLRMSSTLVTCAM